MTWEDERSYIQDSLDRIESGQLQINVTINKFLVEHESLKSSFKLWKTIQLSLFVTVMGSIATLIFK